MENKTGARRIVFGVLLAISLPLALFYPIFSWLAKVSLGDFLDSFLTIVLFLPFFVIFYLFCGEYTNVLRARERILHLAVCAMLIALYVVLNRFVSITTPGFKIGFSVICPMIAGMLFGPAEGALVYGMGDLVSAVVFPFGVYHPGFTLTAILMGFLWGLCTHPAPFKNLIRSYAGDDKKARIKAMLWILVPSAVNCLILGLFVNTIWVAQLYGSKTYWGWFVYRLAEYAIMVPVNVLLAAVILPVTVLLRKQGFGRSRRGRGAQTGQTE